ncbi:uncharacterized protein LOC128683798 [Plodia interpunctella]|uniref:uncharacterized protein LOC128683798 n=1 Tax=Plodia interpunctella TaxID=58824 RepID=UPI00236800D3|nr:uncharacterized protein LOC128683798 [Plodia interpunctella]
MVNMNRHIFVNNMMKSLVIFIVYFVNVKSVPPRYCLHALNKSDCNMKPTPVFSYYKSGSRCEIEYWRGCPTFNKFANQYDCVDTCIYHFGEHAEFNETPVLEDPPNEIDFEEELLDLSDEDLGELEHVVEQVAEDIQRLKITEEAPPPPVTTPEINVTEPKLQDETEEHHTTENDHGTTAPPTTSTDVTHETVPPTTEPSEPEVTTTDKPSSESGLPDEVELP